MDGEHFLVRYRVDEDRAYAIRSVKAATIMGVAEVVQKLHEAGTPALSWEKVTHGAPTKQEQEALEAFLGLAEVPVPPCGTQW